MGSNGKRSRRTNTPRVSWTEEMERTVLSYAKDCLANGKGFEKPTAPDYYKKFLESATGFENVTPDKLVQHMKVIRKAYTSALEWRGKTGQGILSEDPELGSLTVEAELLKRCKYFKEMDELLGDKPQFNPPHFFTSELPLENSVNVEEEEEEHIDLDIVNPPSQISTEKPTSPVKKKPRKSPIKCASAALEAAMKARVESEDRRLDWEKKTEEKRADELKVTREKELEFQQKKLEFEKEKWAAESQQQKLNGERKFELEKLRIEKENEIAKMKLENEFQLEKMKCNHQ